MASDVSRNRTSFISPAVNQLMFACFDVCLRVRLKVRPPTSAINKTRLEVLYIVLSLSMLLSALLLVYYHESQNYEATSATAWWSV